MPSIRMEPSSAKPSKTPLKITKGIRSAVEIMYINTTLLCGEASLIEKLPVNMSLTIRQNSFISSHICL